MSSWILSLYLPLQLYSERSKVSVQNSYDGRFLKMCQQSKVSIRCLGSGLGKDLSTRIPKYAPLGDLAYWLELQVPNQLVALHFYLQSPYSQAAASAQAALLFHSPSSLEAAFTPPLNSVGVQELCVLTPVFPTWLCLVAQEHRVR